MVKKSSSNLILGVIFSLYCGHDNSSFRKSRLLCCIAAKGYKLYSNENSATFLFAYLERQRFWSLAVSSVQCVPDRPVVLHAGFNNQLHHIQINRLIKAKKTTVLPEVVHRRDHLPVNASY